MIVAHKSAYLITGMRACEKHEFRHDAEYFTLAALLASNLIYSAVKVQGVPVEHFTLQTA
jgi:hypothetical protein